MAKQGSNAVKSYLATYNALSAVGWAYVLGVVVIHLFNLDGQSQTVVDHGAKADGLFSRGFSFLQTKSATQAKYQPWIEPIYAQATTAYARTGFATAFVQSFAVLEVVHAALGWVRSPISTTAMQVASRLFLVWGIMDRFPSVHTNPLFASMVLAWSFTEVVRYTFYAFNLAGYHPPLLLYLRYTTFYILYPLGAGSEAFLMFATLPGVSLAAWALTDFGRAVLFAIWWPGLYIMYNYMISQRQKTLGPSKTKTT